MAEPWTIGALLKWTGQYFSGKGIDTPRLDAEVLLSHVLGRDRLYLYTHFDQPLQADELTAFREAVRRRGSRVPVAYITGRREFMGLTFAVTPAVLIPRPDTEVLVETVLALLSGRGPVTFLDIGAGSGAISVSLLHRLPEATAVAVDVSAGALAVAAANAAAHGVDTRLELLRGDLFTPVAGRTFTAVVSNPPYIPDDDIDALAPEVRSEPRLALAGGPDGLSFYRRLTAGVRVFLRPGGFLALEAGAGQADDIVALAAPSGLEAVRTVPDLAGIRRVVVLAASSGEDTP